MNDCLSTNQSFVMVRYDVFDAYSDYVAIQTEDGMYGTEESAFLYQTKYYKGLDVLSLETSNLFTKKLYDVVMDDFDTVGGGATSPNPIKPKPVKDWINELPSFSEIMKAILGIIMVVGLVVVIIAYVPQLLMRNTHGEGAKTRKTGGNRKRNS